MQTRRGMSTSNMSLIGRYIVSGVKLAALISAAVFTACEAVIYYKHDRFATWQDIMDLIATANGKNVLLKQIEEDIGQIQKQGSLLEAESEMLRVKLDDERLACLRKWDDIFEQLKLPEGPFLKKSDITTIENKLSAIKEEMEEFKRKLGEHTHEVAHLKQYFESLNSPNKNIEYHIEDLNERIESILSTIRDTFKSPQIDAFLDAIRNGPFLEEVGENFSSGTDEENNQNQSSNEPNDTIDESPSNETSKPEIIITVQPESKSDQKDDVPNTVEREVGFTTITSPSESADPIVSKEKLFDDILPPTNRDYTESSVGQIKGILKALTEAFLDETEEKLAKQKQHLEAHHKLALEKQGNLLKMAFTDRYSSLIDRIKLIVNRTTRTQRLIVDTLNVNKISNLIDKAEHYLDCCETKLYPRGYLAGLLFETLKRSDISYGYAVGMVANSIPCEVLVDGVDSHYSLVKRFHMLKKDALRLAYIENKEMNLWNFCISYIHSLTHSNSCVKRFDPVPFQHYNYCVEPTSNQMCIGEQSPFEVYCLLEKADQAIIDGNLYHAACYISHIKNYSGHTMRDWLHDVHNYLIARQAVSLLRAYASNNQIVATNSNQQI